jgi:hypothetical protein
MYGLFRLYYRGFTGGAPYVPLSSAATSQATIKVGIPAVPAGGVHVGF